MSTDRRTAEQLATAIAKFEAMADDNRRTAGQRLKARQAISNLVNQATATVSVTDASDQPIVARMRR